MGISSIPQCVSAHIGDVADFSRRHGIRKISLFGSALTDRFGELSDVDLLAEFEPGARVGLFAIASMELELGSLLGRKVDLRTPQDLSRHFREDVLRTAEILYEG